MRKKMIRLQYLCPQIEVFAAVRNSFMNNLTFGGFAGSGEESPEEIPDAKEMDFYSDFSSYGTWKEYMWDDQEITNNGK